MGEGRLPVLRAVLITLVLGVQFLDTIPLPEVTRRDLRWPIAKAEIERWTGVGQSLGMDITEDDTTEFALALGGGAGRFRKTVLRPTHKFRRVTGTGQAWGLFAYPDHFSGRLIIRGHARGEDWETLYTAPGEGEDWLVNLVEYRRIRGIYDDIGDRPRPGAMYKSLSRWLGKQVMLRHDDHDEVELRLDLVRVHTPDEGEEPEQKRRNARVERRDELLP